MRDLTHTLLLSISKKDFKGENLQSVLIMGEY